MSVLEILRWPDERLRTPCAPVGGMTDEIGRLVDRMFETMYAAPGRGLAAPQVGVLKRLFVMDAGWKDGAVETRAEGCLSLPGVTVEVTRPALVTLRWTDLAGVRQEKAFDGFAAACVQHEMDHLDGVMTLDHLTPGAREAALAEYGEALRA